MPNFAQAMITASESVASRSFGDRMADVRNALDFTDATDSGFQQAINRAIDVATGQGGGCVVVPNLGSVYSLTGAIVQKDDVDLIGWGTPTLKLANGANCDVLLTENAYAYFGTDTPNNVSNFSIQSMILDGNAANQSASSQDSKNGIAMYASNFILRDVTILNAKGHGVRSEYYQYGEGTGGLEPVIDNVVIDRVGRHGWWNKGPHDVNSDHVVVIDASQEADETYMGLLIEGTANGRFFNFHGWHRSATTNRVAFQGKSSGGCEFVACHFEGGRQQFLHTGLGGDEMIACKFYAPFGAADQALVIFDSNSNRHVACGYGGNEAKDIYGIQFGVTGNTTVSINEVIEGRFSNFKTRSPFNFENEGNDKVSGIGFTATSGGATTFGGTVAASTDVDYEQSGTVIRYKKMPIIGGTDGDTRSRTNAGAMGAGKFSAQGDAQRAWHTLRRQTTSETQSRLTSDGVVSGASNLMNIPDNCFATFKGRVVAKSGSNMKAWEVEGEVYRGAGAGTTVVVGSPTITAKNSTGTVSGWDVNFSVDTTFGGITILITGAAATTINWVGYFDAAEVVA